MIQNPTNEDIIKKMEYFCAYQDRCHDEVIRKMRSMAVVSEDLDAIMVHLIEHNFLNEERFACSFARGKHRIKFWGNVRIINELKAQNISKTNITTALKEIANEEYLENFNRISDRHWETLSEKNALKKRKKFCDYLLRKGFESQLVYEKIRQLECN